MFVTIDHRHLHRADEATLPPISKACLEFFHSGPFCLLLAHLTGLELAQNVIRPVVIEDDCVPTSGGESGAMVLDCGRDERESDSDGGREDQEGESELGGGAEDEEGGEGNGGGRESNGGVREEMEPDGGAQDEDGGEGNEEGGREGQEGEMEPVGGAQDEEGGKGKGERGRESNGGGREEIEKYTDSESGHEEQPQTEASIKPTELANLRPPAVKSDRPTPELVAQQYPSSSQPTGTLPEAVSVAPGTPAARCGGELCRWQAGNYTLASDTDQQLTGGEYTLDLMLPFCCDGEV